MSIDLVPASDLALIEALSEAVGNIEVVDEETNRFASELLRDVKGMNDKLKQRVTDLRRPHLAAANAVSEAARPYLEELLSNEQHLRGQVGGYMKRERDKARAEEQERQEALERAIVEGRHEEAQSHLEAALVPVERPWRPAGVSLQDRWEAEVTDLRAYVAWAAGRMTEDRWLLPNQSLLDQEARRVKGESAIPGVVFRSTTSTAVAGR